MVSSVFERLKRHLSACGQNLKMVCKNKNNCNVSWKNCEVTCLKFLFNIVILTFHNILFLRKGNLTFTLMFLRQKSKQLRV